MSEGKDELIRRIRRITKDRRLWKHLSVIFIFLVICLIHWKVKVENEVAYHDVLTAAADGSVTMPFESITGFEILNHDKAIGEFLGDHMIRLNIVIEDENHLPIWEWSEKDLQISGEFSTRLISDMDPGVEVEKGHVYYVTCYSPDVTLQNVTFRLYGGRAGFGGIYLLFVFVAFLTLLIPLGLSYFKKKIPMERLCFMMILSTGMLYNIVMPPIAGPDEPYHFVQAYAVSDFLLGKDTDYVHPLVPEDMNNVRYVHIKQTLYSFYEHLFEPEFHEDKVEYMYREKDLQRYPFYTYLASGIGIAAGRILHLNIQWMLLFGRFANLLMAAFLMSLALRLLPYAKRSFLIFMMIPMVLCILGVYSYDCINLCLVYIFFSLCLRFADRTGRMRWRDTLMLTVIGAMFVPIKIIYIPILLGALMIPAGKYKSRLTWFASNAAVLAGGVAAILAMRIQEVLATINVSSIAAETAGGAAAVQDAAPSLYTIGWVLQNPLATVKIYLNTLYEEADSYFLTAFGSRYTDIFIPSVVIFTVAAVFFFVCATDETIPCFSWGKKALLLFIGGSGLFLAMTVMLFAHTKMGGDSITGVNGRYLLPFFVCIPFILKSKIIGIKRDITYPAVTAMVMLNTAVLLLVFGDTLRW